MIRKFRCRYWLGSRDVQRGREGWVCPGEIVVNFHTVRAGRLWSGRK
jgi:hypothetical protein